MLKLKNLEGIELPYRECIEKYIPRLYANFGEDLIGVLLFGSVARGEQKSFESLRSDIDLLVIIEGLVPIKERSGQRRKLNPWVTHIRSEWITKKELDGYFAAKTGFILDAFDEGYIVYDPSGYLKQKRQELFEQLKQKGVKRTKLGWVFPIKIGERIEY